MQTVDDGWHYEFRPSDLLQLLPHAKIIAALRERLERIDQGPFGEPLPQLAAEADALQEVVGTAREIRRLWKRVWLYSGGVVRVSADAYDSEGFQRTWTRTRCDVSCRRCSSSKKYK